jgi:DNA-binding transcriptional LysR family regulator
MFDFRLKLFHSVATNLSFTRAAEELYITQPAVTKNIKELEKVLQISLFERNKTGITLTKAGKLLLEHTNKIREQEKGLEYAIGLLRDSFSGGLKLGASTTIGQYILPAVLAGFHTNNPEIKISLLNKNTGDIEKDLLMKEIDLGIIEGNSRKRELKYIPFMKDEIVAIAHTKQPISKITELSLQELTTTPLVLREAGSGSLEVILSALQKHKIKLKNLHVIMHLGSTESIKSFLRNYNCIGFVSVHAVSHEIFNGEFKIIDINNLEIVRTFNFIYPQGKQDGLTDKFIDYTISVTKKQ